MFCSGCIGRTALFIVFSIMGRIFEIDCTSKECSYSFLINSPLKCLRFHFNVLTFRNEQLSPGRCLFTYDTNMVTSTCAFKTKDHRLFLNIVFLLTNYSREMRASALNLNPATLHLNTAALNPYLLPFFYPEHFSHVLRKNSVFVMPFYANWWSSFGSVFQWCC